MAQHRLCTTRSFPMQMWLSGQLQNPVGMDDVNMADIPMYGVEGNIGEEDKSIQQSPIFDPLNVDLNENCLQEMTDRVPTMWMSNIYGIDKFEETLRIIKDHIHIQGCKLDLKIGGGLILLVTPN